jgi:hypothetical protein
MRKDMGTKNKFESISQDIISIRRGESQFIYLIFGSVLVVLGLRVLFEV